MNIVIRIFFFLLPTLALFGQSAAPLQYTISVTLDDERHLLDGYWELDYTNTSQDTLYDFYLHLWPNAYGNRRSPLALQLLREGNTQLHFAADSSLGYLQNLDFQIDEAKLNYTTTEDVPDIAYFQLPKALAPGQSIRFSTPFLLKIPASFSRLGHVGQSYQLTQWFPKVAMYDTSGWHPMPYLSYGEYYSPFADFSVSIQLPENYIVAASGLLQNQEEKDWLARQANTASLQASDRFPASAKKQKTLRFKANRVHDFAWFADKRFRIEQDTLQLPSGKIIDAAVYYPATQANLWKNALTYVKRATSYYSKRVGEYPYPQVSAVHAPFSEGGGMEYPMLTLIGWEMDAKDLDAVIAHEVGHNWFYGALASNERRDAWMDEGINYYYELAYLERYYPQASPAKSKVLSGSMAEYTQQSRQGRRQIVQQSSELLPPENYWLNAYDIPQIAFGQWAALIGQDRFDQAIQAYYEAWKFKHPQPEDMQQSLEQTSGQDLNWLFQGLLNSTKEVDYALKSMDAKEVLLINNGAIAAPFPLQFYRTDSLIAEQWQEGFLGEQILRFPQLEFDAIAIDAHMQCLEVKRHNNYWKRPIALRFFTAAEEPDRKQLFYSPLLTYNAYDGISPSLALHNFTYPSKNFQWAVLPSYGFNSNSWSGNALAFWQKPMQAGPFRRWVLEAQARTYHFRELPNEDGLLSYNRQALSSRFYFRSEPISTQRHRLQFSLLRLGVQQAVYSNDGVFQGPTTQTSWIPRLQYQIDNKRVLSPFRWTNTLEQQTYTDAFNRSQSYLKFSSEFSGKWLYQKDHHFFYRLFFGFFPQHTGRNAGIILPGAFSLIPLGSYDYAFDHYYLGRSETDGLLSQQVGRWDGAFKTPIFPGQSLGRSNNFLWAINLSADLPFGPSFLPLRPYLDLGYADDASPLGRNLSFQDQFHWNAGLSLEYLDGHIGIYLPLAGSRNLMDRLSERTSYFSRIGLRLSLGSLISEVRE